MTCSGLLVFGVVVVVVDVVVVVVSLFRRVCWRKGTGGKLHERLCRSC